MDVGARHPTPSDEPDHHSAVDQGVPDGDDVMTESVSVTDTRSNILFVGLSATGKTTYLV